MENARQTTDVRVRDLLLIILTVSSGATDAISYLALGKVFTAFMTANVVFLGLRTASAGDFNAVRIAIALAAFSAGCFLSTLIVKPSRGSGVWPRRVTIALGVAAIAQAVFLSVWVATDGWPSNGFTNALVVMWGLAMGMQTAAVFSLGLRGVFTTAATATLVVLVSDVADRPQSATENRLLAGVLISLFVGAAAGSLLLKHARLHAPALPLVGSALAIAIAECALRKRSEGLDRR
ncbi:MAG TPA: YoaK family protein [Blastocatellia bacterium]